MPFDDSLIELALRAFATFFATIGPVDVAAIYAALTASAPPRQRRIMAVKGTTIATLLLLSFVLAGEAILEWLGITLAAMRAAGGILLLLLAIDMVFARPEATSKATYAETSEAEAKEDISVFPLATPLIAGPAALGAAVLLAAEARDSLVAELVVVCALLLIMALQLCLLFCGGKAEHVSGRYRAARDFAHCRHPARGAGRAVRLRRHTRQQFVSANLNASDAQRPGIAANACATPSSRWPPGKGSGAA